MNVSVTKKQHGAGEHGDDILIIFKAARFSVSFQFDNWILGLLHVKLLSILFIYEPILLNPT